MIVSIAFSSESPKEVKFCFSLKIFLILLAVLLLLNFYHWSRELHLRWSMIQTPKLFQLPSYHLHLGMNEISKLCNENSCLYFNKTWWYKCGRRWHYIAPCVFILELAKYRGRQVAQFRLQVVIMNCSIETWISQRLSPPHTEKNSQYSNILRRFFNVTKLINVAT